MAAKFLSFLATYNKTLERSGPQIRRGFLRAVLAWVFTASARFLPEGFHRCRHHQRLQSQQVVRLRVPAATLVYKPNDLTVALYREPREGILKNWLELEAGVTPLFARHSTEWDTDFLFKKPWTLSKKVEFMFGVGPAWVHTRQSGMTMNSVGAEAVLDFMFWPSEKRRFGW